MKCKLKSWLASILSVVVVLFSNVIEKAEACTGARNMAMGFASVAACNDSHAVYFNQAALPLMKDGELRYTQRLGDDTIQRYDHVLSFSYPITSRFALGFQAMDSVSGKWNIEKESCVKIGAGYIFSGDINSDIAHSIGGSLTSRDIRLKNYGGETEIGSFFNEDITYLYQRRNALYTNDKFRAGVNLRILTGLNGTSTRVRPALSYAIPNSFLGLDDLTLAFEYYELDKVFRRLRCKNKDFGVEGPRFGLEQKIGNIAIRVGYEDIQIGESYSGGIGINFKNFEISSAVKSRQRAGSWGLLEVAYRF